MTVTAVDERLLLEIIEGCEAAVDANEALMINPQTVHTLATELLAARKEIAGLREGLTRIGGGRFDGAGNLALDGNWREFVNRLQDIARNLLAGGNSNE